MSGLNEFQIHHYDAICCDIGDVIVYDFPIRLAFSYYFHQHVTREWPTFDLGPWEIVSAGGRHEGALSCVEPELCQAACRGAWASVIAQWRSLCHPIPAALAALRRLKGSRLAFVANQPPETLRVLEDLDCIGLAEHVLLDTLCGVSKPDIRLLEMALLRLGLPAERTVMVGDRLDNDIVPAKQLGAAAVWTQPLPYDPDLPVPQVPQWWRARYEHGQSAQVLQTRAAYDLLPAAQRPDACVASLSEVITITT